VLALAAVLRVGGIGHDSLWGDEGLTKRIDRAAFELVLLMESGFARQVRDESWQSYQHEFGSAGGTELEIDIDSDLMRLATGGSAR